MAVFKPFTFHLLGAVIALSAQDFPGEPGQQYVPISSPVYGEYYGYQKAYHGGGYKVITHYLYPVRGSICEQVGGVCRRSCYSNEIGNGLYTYNGCPHGETCCTANECKDEKGCNCRRWCRHGEEEECGKCCDKRMKCCKSAECVLDSTCDCKESCDLSKEMEDGTGECCSDVKKCCRPCDETNVCGKNGGTCKSSCGDGEEADGTCCNGDKCCVCADKKGCRCISEKETCLSSEIEDGECCETGTKCCMQCLEDAVCDRCSNTCDNKTEIDSGPCCSNGSLRCCNDCKDFCKGGCVDNAASCPDGKSVIGPCCAGKKCCSEEPLCRSTDYPLACALSSDERCTGNFTNGVCPKPNVKCCQAECGYTCKNEHGGACMKNADCKGDAKSIGTTDCCQPEICCVE